jgi:hypothetical protein
MPVKRGGAAAVNGVDARSLRHAEVSSMIAAILRELPGAAFCLAMIAAGMVM